MAVQVIGPATYWLLTPSSFTVPIPAILLDGDPQLGMSRFQRGAVAPAGRSQHADIAKLCND